MKFLVLIFVSLFFVNVHAADSAPATPSTPAGLTVKPVEIPAGDAGSVKALLDSQEKKELNQACTDAMKERKEDVKTAKEKIEELEDKKAEEKERLQKEINEKDEAISQADVDYKKARDEIMSEINVANEEKDTQLRTLNEKLTQQIQALKKIIVTDRNKIERDYQQSLKGAYAQCKIIAEKDLKDRRTTDRAEKQAQNTGQIKTGGAGFNGNTNKKIKTEVIVAYKACLAMAEEALKGKRTNDLEESKDKEDAAKSDIANTQQELSDYVTKKYPNKAVELNEKLNTAAEENTQKKNSLAQAKQTLQQALNERMASLDKQINARRAEIMTQKLPAGRERDELSDENQEDLRLAACCKPIEGKSEQYEPADNVTSGGRVCQQLSKRKGKKNRANR